MNVGEFHYVGRDIETSYPGLRIFQVNSDSSRTGLAMYWNDTLVQGAATTMQNGALGLAVSEGSVTSGLYTSAASANNNARSWGDFSGAGKGNVSFLDTYVWIDSEVSTTISVSATDDTDTDGDGLSDHTEECLIGSDPLNVDTDGDGQSDSAQYSVPESSTFAGLKATAVSPRLWRVVRFVACALARQSNTS